MKISATINNRLNENEIVVKTNEVSKEISIAPKQNGLGSSKTAENFYCLLRLLVFAMTSIAKLAKEIFRSLALK